MNEYEGKVWSDDKGWHAKVLRNGMYLDARNGFGTRADALTWAREQADADRAYVKAEAEAERVTL